MEKISDKSKKMYSMILFIIYIILLTWIIVFKFQFSIDNLDRARSLNLVPFKGALILNGHIDFTEIIQNLLIFIPYGIYLSVLESPELFYKKVLAFLGTSLLFELMQFILMIGRSDITDIIENTFGGILGVALYRVLLKVLSSKKKTDKFFVSCATIVTILIIILFGVIFLNN